MKLVILIPLFISCIAFGQSQSKDSIYTKPEIAAKFKYDDKELNNFFSTNKQLPYIAVYYGINGQVELTITIDSSGKFKEIVLNKETYDVGVLSLKNDVMITDDDLNGLFGGEAKRLVMLLSGLYIPASNSGVHVPSALTLTITFTSRQYEQNQRDFKEQLHHKKNIKWNFGEYLPYYNMKRDTIRYKKGVEKYSENKFDLARIYFEEAVRINPKYIDAYYNLGYVDMKLNESSKACEAWGKAKELGDTEVPALIEKYCK